MKFNTYTCGQNVHRLKGTTVKLSNGSYFVPDATHIFNDYRYSKNHQIALPNIQSLQTEIIPVANLFQKETATSSFEDEDVSQKNVVSV
jgi:hypothetical protein